MKKLLLNMVGGLPSEWARIAALLTLGFFTGIFMASYSVSINTLFISQFGNENDFPLALVTQGILGIIFTILFSRLQNIIGFRKLVYYTSIIILLIVGSIATSLLILEKNDIVVFLGFATLGPIASISLLIFWGAFGRLFNFTQSKRLSGGIDTGQAVATILAFFSVPLVQQLLPSLEYLSLIGVLSYVGCFFSIVYILRKFKMHSAEALTLGGNSNEDKTKRVKLRDYKSYFFVISIFVMCSSFSAAFVDYSFVTVTPQYFLEEQELANFLAFFEAFVIIVSFLVQTFLNDRILEVYGLQYSLMLLPGILVFFCVIDLVIGSLFGHDQSSNAFLMFFLIISMSKLVTDALRDSLENPTVKIFFFPLPSEIRYEAQTLVEGTVAQFSTLGAGILMIGISKLNSYNILYNNFVIFAIVGVWVFVTFKMYNQYRISLQNLLSANSTELDYHDSVGHRFKNNKIQNLLQMRWNSVPQKVAPLLFKLIERLDIFLYRNILSDEGNLLRFINKREALMKIKEYSIYESIPALDNFSNGSFDDDDILLVVAKNLSEELNAEITLEINDENILYLSKSSTPSDRIRAARLMFNEYKESYDGIISRLIRDYNYQVRVEAMGLVGHHKISTMIPALVERLSIKGDERIALSAIIAVGESGAKILETAFHKNGQVQQTKRLILQAYAKIGSEESVQLLADKITSPERKISYEALSLLSELGWNAEDEYSQLFLKEALKREANNCYWNIATTLEIGDSKETTLLHRAIQSEILDNYNQMFLIMNMLYDRGSLNLIRKNHELGTADSIGYAVELLDVLIDEDIKAYVLPLFEDIGVEDRIKKLSELFYREQYSSEYVLVRLITRDPNWLSSWVRACALYAISYKPAIINSEIIVGLLFDSELLMSEMAAWILTVNFPELLEEAYPRLSQSKEADIRDKMRSIENMKWTNAPHLVFSKALYYSNLSEFHGLSGNELVEIASISSIRFVEAGKKLGTAEELKRSGLFVVKEGELGIGEGDEHTILYKKRSLLGTYISPQSDAWIGDCYAIEDTSLYEIDEESFFLLMTTDMHMVELIMNNVRRSFRTSINLQKVAL
ncbi:MFS transporter [Flammeovirga agarivorans]|uniref:MFS transporter n=1 Tax=Flammeovirga agarivorans TaxID=2726742 RepID=A0A7X8SLS4_9BACT|nr:MFS transporter [Flammeovirga agarivorans]NLR92576.1 MFS transporter [Flammeovirga agarivorans]